MDIHTYFSQLGKRSADKMTPEQREARARAAARTRWGQPKNPTIKGCIHTWHGIICNKPTIKDGKYCHTHANG